MSNEQKSASDKKENDSEINSSKEKHEEITKKGKDTGNQPTPPVKPKRDLLILLTIFLVIFNGILAWTSVQLSCNATKSTKLTEKSLIASDKANREALRKSDSSLAIADSSLKIASLNLKTISENARKELRAYVVLSSDTITIQIKAKEKIATKMSIVNVGKTPAYNVFHTNSCFVADSITKSDFIPLFAIANRHQNTGDALGSGLRQNKLGIYDTLSTQDFNDIYSKKKKFFLMGVVGYEDIFNKRHLLWYAMFYDTERSGLSYIENYGGNN